jgi:DNA polymerase I-like protein with 3'-5' exonuclease and polymerase domains
VHDELVLEVEPSLVAEAVKLVQISMEGAASLLGMMQCKKK